LASISRRTFQRLCRRAPTGTSPVTTAISASKSMPQASSAKTASSVGPEVVAAALVHQRVGVEAGRASLPRALRTSSTWFR
jgi:hypothetical protein